MTNLVTIKTLVEGELLHWDVYVQSHPSHSPYHLSGWGRAVSKSYKHRPVYIAAFEQGVIVGVLPLVVFSVPFKGSQLCSLPFCDLGGALADSSAIKMQLEQYANDLCHRQKNTSVEIRERVKHTSKEVDWQGKKVSMLLKLPSTAEELMASFRSKLRSQIRKAEKNGLTFELGTDKSFIDKFYLVFSENMHRLGSPVHSRTWFVSLVEQYQYNCLISIVKKDDLVVGAGLILFTENVACIPWASTKVEYNRLSPNMLLYWSLLEYCASHSIGEFDFGRSTFNEGTYKFKAQWGALPQSLFWRQLGAQICVDEPVSTQSKLRGIVEETWRKMPLAMANIVGPQIRRFISL